MNKLIFLSILMFSFGSMALEMVQGILFYPYKMVDDPKSISTQMKVYSQPDFKSTVITTIIDTQFEYKKEKLNVSEYRYETAGLPVLEVKDKWYKVGFPKETEDRLGPVSKFNFIGWVTVEKADYVPIVEFLKSSMIETVDWDQNFFKSAGATEKIKVNYPDKETKSRRGMEVVEVKMIGQQTWLKLKAKDACESDTVHAEGWLPLSSKDKILFDFFSRGC